MSKRGQRNSDSKDQLEAVRAQQRRAERRRWMLVGIGPAMAVLLVGGAVWAGVSSQRRTANASSWQNCGIYNAPVTNENAVHSLEHGAHVDHLPAESAGRPAGRHQGRRGRPEVRPRQPLPHVSGRQAPEPGGECTGGTGTPTG